MLHEKKTTGYWASPVESGVKYLAVWAGIYMGAAVLLEGQMVRSATGEMIFGLPTNLGPGINTANLDNAPTISPDGLELFFTSNRIDGLGGADIWVMKRSSVSDPWGEPNNLGIPVNSVRDEGTTSISSDGLTLYFSAYYRPGGYGNWDLWMTTRTTTASPWGPPINLGPKVNSVYDELFPSISSDGRELYFSDWLAIRPGGCGLGDVWVTTRSSIDDPWGDPNSPGPSINGLYNDGSPYISGDGQSLYLCSERPGGYGRSDMWVASRASASEPWSVPVNLGSIVNSTSYDGAVCFSADKAILYLGSSRSGGYGDYDLWQIPVSYTGVCGDDDHPYPIGDVNQDCRVDFYDLALVAAHWLEDNNP